MAENKEIGGNNIPETTGKDTSVTEQDGSDTVLNMEISNQENSQKVTFNEKGVLWLTFYDGQKQISKIGITSNILIEALLECIPIQESAEPGSKVPLFSPEFRDECYRIMGNKTHTSTPLGNI